MEEFLEEFAQSATQFGHHFQSWSHVYRHEAKTSAAAQVSSLWHERVSKLQAYDRRMPAFRSGQECYQHKVRTEQSLVAAAAKSLIKVWMDHFQRPSIPRAPQRDADCHLRARGGGHARPWCQPWATAILAPLKRHGFMLPMKWLVCYVVSSQEKAS